MSRLIVASSRWKGNGLDFEIVGTTPVADIQANTMASSEFPSNLVSLNITGLKLQLLQRQSQKRFKMP